MIRQLSIVFLLSSISLMSIAGSLTLQSKNKQTGLIELYTSEGCSSCPRADEWLSELTTHSKLWQDFVPVAFHVDYWDYLGWVDPFASAEHSNRQRTHKWQRNINSVYTPGFVVAGREWRGWFSGKRLALPQTEAGVLTLNTDGDIFSATFKESHAPSKDAELTVAWLGFGLETVVKRGENRGKTLAHDFVLLNSRRFKLLDGEYKASLPHVPKNFDYDRLALVAWVNYKGNIRPVQAVGGWYNN